MTALIVVESINYDNVIKIIVICLPCNLCYHVHRSYSNYMIIVSAICHSVFGNSDEDIISCCQSAMETAYEQNYKSIVSQLAYM